MIERNSEIQSEFAACIGTYEPEQLIFIDVSAVDRYTRYHERAWTIYGRKATCKAFFCGG